MNNKEAKANASLLPELPFLTPALFSATPPCLSSCHRPAVLSSPSLTGIDRTLPCDDRLCGGDCRKNCFGLARHPVGHEAARQVNSEVKCVTFHKAVHLLLCSILFCSYCLFFISGIFSQKSLPRKQCVAVRRWAGLVSNKKLFNRLIHYIPSKKATISSKLTGLKSFASTPTSNWCRPFSRFARLYSTGLCKCPCRL